MVWRHDMENTHSYQNYENSSKQWHFVLDSKCLMW